MLGATAAEGRGLAPARFGGTLMGAEALAVVVVGSRAGTADAARCGRTSTAARGQFEVHTNTSKMCS